ncbi:hypothetical protein H1V43_32145 [Streptomyces sp. PSKA54]|uniref:Uncharacterized protein n=1 Tax=Streptomyces himalayensis subsp. aureolus TaxID=2758039 RepID=A0A7W2D764_9ACTN|nr:hypothetical protein [Streptomyces himalayensis]MBA4865916.1 hypothetical protein [Streptomyces himalayensis subsp. aureolus]
MAQEALGRLVDISTGFTPVDLATAGATGKRVSLRGAGGVLVLVSLAAAASGTESVTLTLQEHSASSGGTSQNLAVIDHYYRKAEATLDGDEQWTRVSQTAAATISVAGASFATQEVLIAIEVNATSLSDGFAYVSVSASDPGTVARVAECVYVLRDLVAQRAPASLAAPLS